MTADTIGGVWTYALELIQALPSIEFGLATMGRRINEEQKNTLQRVPNITIFESEWKLEWMQDPWRDVQSAGDWLLALEAEFGPDVVHLNGYAHGSLPWQAPRLIVAHSCVLSWWQAVHNTSAPAAWDEYARAAKRGVDAVDMIVAPTRAMRQALLDLYAPAPPSRVIYNGRSGPTMPSVPKEPVIVAAGRLWDEGKNISLLRKVAPHLPWPVCLVGEEHANGLPENAPNVRSLGRMRAANLWSLLHRAAIYAFPAKYEPFGLSVLEAAMSGCALVLADISSLRELWDDAALFERPDDENAWARVLTEVAGDCRLRDSLASRARRRAAEYSSQRMAEAYLDCYRGLLRPEHPHNAHAKTQPAFV